MSKTDDILKFLEAAFDLVPLAIAAGTSTKLFATIAADAVRNGGTPTPAAWDKLKAEERRLRDIIHKPV